MAVSRFLIGGVASALLLTGGLFLWKGYSQIAEEEELPEPPPALPAIPVAGAGAPKRGPAPPELPAAKEASRDGNAGVARRAPQPLKRAAICSAPRAST